MKLLTKDIHERLLNNGRIRRDWPMDRFEPDFVPVVKLFTPDAPCLWLLTEIDPDDPDIAFGLADLGVGFPELGSVRLSELAIIRGPAGLPIERDRFFNPTRTLSDYAAEATCLCRVNA